ncbi:MAG TPA: S-layer homology domain-containing protein [Paenibacillaceae bacterium]
MALLGKGQFLRVEVTRRVETIVGAGLTSGRAAGRLDPGGLLTRAEAAAVIHRFLRHFGLIQHHRIRM